MGEAGCELGCKAGPKVGGGRDVWRLGVAVSRIVFGFVVCPSWSRFACGHRSR